VSVRLHIDRLVLDGVDVPYASHDELRAAVEQELVRLISSGGLPRAFAMGLAVPAVGGPAIDGAGPPRKLGAAIAGAVYGGIGGAAR
jgi:hypothetical protein